MIAPDYRGFGGSELDGSQVGVNDYAKDVLGLLDGLSLDTAVLGGLSLGGYVIFEILRIAPQRCDALILADTRSTADSEAGRRTRRDLLATVRRRGVKTIAQDFAGKLLGDTTKRQRPEILAQVVSRIEAAKQVGVEAAIVALMNRPDSTGDLARIACPTLIIVGEEDTVTPVGDAEALHRGIAGSRLVRLERAGHLSNLEVPEEFSTTISGWVESLQS
jgi:pimeloyl-ACP methyl ester carboxylesterase